MNQQGYIFMGMSGVGKTTLGEQFAKLINYDFLDSDHLIERLRKLPLSEVVEGYSDKQEFINYEGEVLQGIELYKKVLATGGSACYSELAIQKLKDKGAKVIYLDIEWAVLSNRIDSFEARGIILLERNFEAEYYTRREKYARLADCTIKCGDSRASDLLDVIVKQVVGRI